MGCHGLRSAPITEACFHAPPKQTRNRAPETRNLSATTAEQLPRPPPILTVLTVHSEPIHSPARDNARLQEFFSYRLTSLTADRILITAGPDNGPQPSRSLTRVHPLQNRPHVRKAVRPAAADPSRPDTRPGPRPLPTPRNLEPNGHSTGGQEAHRGERPLVRWF